MILLPEFSENKDDSVVMYFPVEGDKKALEKVIDNTYYCYSRLDYVMREGKEYLALEVDSLEE